MRAVKPWTFLCHTLCLIGVFSAHLALAGTAPMLPRVAHRIEMQEGLRIIAFGSSSTEGIGASSKDRCYPSRLQALLAQELPKGVDVTVLNRGIGGEDVDDMMRRLPAIIAEKPDLVIWQTGSNDVLRAVPLDHFVSATQAGIAQMQDARIDVVLMEPQLSDRLAQVPDARSFRDAVRDLGRKMHVLVVRRYDLMRQWLSSGQLTQAELMSRDGLHMADGGYAKLAMAVAATILAGSQAAVPHLAAK